MLFRKFSISTFAALVSFGAFAEAKLSGASMMRELQSDPDLYALSNIAVNSAIQVDGTTTKVASIEMTIDHAALTASAPKYAISYRDGDCSALNDYSDGTLTSTEGDSNTLNTADGVTSPTGTKTFVKEEAAPASVTAPLTRRTTIKHPLNLLRDISGLYSATPSSTAASVTVTMKYCVRVSMLTEAATTPPTVANFKQVAITFTGTLDQDENWQGTITAVPTTTTTGTITETYSVTTFVCNDSCNSHTDCLNALATTAPTVNQNDEVDICIAMSSTSLGKASIQMLASFAFQRTSPSSVSQTAVSSNAAGDLCSINVPCSADSDFCKFSCNFKQEFFQDADGNAIFDDGSGGTIDITGTGIVQLNIGGRRRQLQATTDIVMASTLIEVEVREEEDDGFCSGGFWGLPGIRFFCKSILVPLFLGPIFNIKA